MKSSLTEVREWLAALNDIIGPVGLYLAWRWRPPKGPRDVTIEAPSAIAVGSGPTPVVLNLPGVEGKSSASLQLTTSPEIHFGPGRPSVPISQ
jgi:hypothetical protein